MERPWRRAPPPRPKAAPPPRATSSCVLTVVFLPLIILGIVFLVHLQLYGQYPLLSFFPAAAPSLRRDCEPSRGRWERGRRPLRYNGSCPFHRNAWNCLRNGREGMEAINSWVWIPETCGSDAASPPEVGLDPAAFLSAMRGRRIGFVGDSLNENFVVSFLCTLWSADGGARKWKKKGAWRGGYFPHFDVTVAYHRAVLLSRYQ